MPMEASRIKYLSDAASCVRKDIVRMVGLARSGPLRVPLAFSDILVYLYWEELFILPSRPSMPERDIFLLGIADACPSLYAVLAKRGYFDRDELWHYRRLGSMLQASPDYGRTPGVDAPCSDSWHELLLAASFSISAKLANKSTRVFCFCPLSSATDSVFAEEVKAIASAASDNLVLITARGLGLSPEDEAEENFFTASGWETKNVKAHDFFDMERVFSSFDYSSGRPKAVFVTDAYIGTPSFMEKSGISRRNPMNTEYLWRALEELEEN